MTSNSQSPESDTQADLRVTDETLNRQLHEARGLCWHSKSLLYCLRCRGFKEDMPLAGWVGLDYCNDAGLWTYHTAKDGTETPGEMVKWIEEKDLRRTWAVWIREILEREHTIAVTGSYMSDWELFTTSPRLRTIAVLRALGIAT